MFSSAWPILRTYDSDHLRRIALPLGGIGTGTLSLGGRGDLRDWEVGNRPGEGICPNCLTRRALLRTICQGRNGPPSRAYLKVRWS